GNIYANAGLVAGKTSVTSGGSFFNEGATFEGNIDVEGATAYLKAGTISKNITIRGGLSTMEVLGGEIGGTLFTKDTAVAMLKGGHVATLNATGSSTVTLEDG